MTYALSQLVTPVGAVSTHAQRLTDMLLTVPPCNVAAPPFWWPWGLVCVRPHGHEIKYHGTLRKRCAVIGTEHCTPDGRVWPSGHENIEFA